MASPILSQFEIAECPTLNSRPLLDDFLAACALAKQRPARSHSPFQIRDRAARLLRRALLRIR